MDMEIFGVGKNNVNKSEHIFFSKNAFNLFWKTWNPL